MKNKRINNTCTKNVTFTSSCPKSGIKIHESNNEYKKNIIIPLMCDVRENHTYINRIQTIFDCFMKQMIK